MMAHSVKCLLASIRTQVHIQSEHVNCWVWQHISVMSVPGGGDRRACWQCLFGGWYSKHQ